MEVILGRFRDLEAALLSALQGVKGAGEWTAAAIVTPSEALRRHLKRLLAEKRINLLNVHFQTLRGLALKIGREYSPEDLNEDLFLEREILRAIVEKDPDFAPLARTPRGIPALFETLLDLREASADPRLLREAIDEEIFPRSGRLESLFGLYERFCEARSELGIMDRVDLFRRISESPPSRFLTSLSALYYYGSYDFNVSQLDLLCTIDRQVPITLFFPFVRDHPAFLFARNFLERHLGRFPIRYAPEAGEDPPLSESLTLLFSDAPPPPPPKRSKRASKGRLALWSASGTEDEVAAVAKEILRLRHEEGFDYSEIGVVARNLAPYRAAVRRIFRDHAIPLVCSREPLLRYPYAKNRYLLSALPGVFGRDDLLDLALLPDLRWEQIAPPSLGGPPPIARWRQAVLRRVRGGGIAEWENFFAWGDETFLGLRLLFEKIRGGFAKPHSLCRPEAFAAALRDLASELFPPPSKEGIAEAVDEAYHSMEYLEILNREWDPSTLSDAFRRRLSEGEVNARDQNLGGVRLLDAMSARGLSFRTLFLLGLNDRLFPRVIRQDGFLRDSERSAISTAIETGVGLEQKTRRTLETTVGLKLPQKEEAYAEERLLFYLLLNSARERIYLLHQRSDDEGGALAPSPYLWEIRRLLSEEQRRNERRILLRREEKIRDPLFSCYATPREAMLIHLLQRRPAKDLRRYLGSVAAAEHPLWLTACSAARKLSRWNRPGEEDGLIGLSDPPAQQSPTSLSEYLTCPFAYFARRILRLGREEESTLSSGIDPRKIGLICDRLISAATPLVSSGAGPDAIRSALEPLLAQLRAEHPAFALLWETIQEGLVAEILALLEEESRRGGGFSPFLVQPQMAGEIGGLSIVGRPDRVDVNADSRLFRILDFKFTRGARLGSKKNLLPATLSGKLLAPALYLLLASKHPGLNGMRPESANLLFVAPHLDEKERCSALDAEEFSKSSEEFLAIIEKIGRGIRHGEFPIRPSAERFGHCARCEFFSACRKEHPPSRRRGEIAMGRGEDP